MSEERLRVPDDDLAQEDTGGDGPMDREDTGVGGDDDGGGAGPRSPGPSDFARRSPLHGKDRGKQPR